MCVTTTFGQKMLCLPTCFKFQKKVFHMKTNAQNGDCLCCLVLFLGKKMFVTPISFVYYFHVIHFLYMCQKLYEHKKSKKIIITLQTHLLPQTSKTMKD